MRQGWEWLKARNSSLCFGTRQSESGYQLLAGLFGNPSTYGLWALWENVAPFQCEETMGPVGSCVQVQSLSLGVGGDSETGSVGPCHTLRKQLLGSLFDSPAISTDDSLKQGRGMAHEE